MGPPSLVVAASNRRSTRASDEAPPVQHFPRRLPRTGTAFQCKVPSDVANNEYGTSRQAPSLMSVDFPHRSAMELHTNQISESNGKGIHHIRNKTAHLVDLRGRTSDRWRAMELLLPRNALERIRKNALDSAQ